MNRYEQARSKMGAKAMESLRRATSTARRLHLFGPLPWSTP